MDLDALFFSASTSHSDAKNASIYKIMLAFLSIHTIMQALQVNNAVKAMTENVTGRAKGGVARANSLDPEKRAEIASKAAKARWSGKETPKATHTGELNIGDLEIDCAVLPDGTRVLSQRSVGRALGRSYGGADWRRGANEDGSGKLPFFLNSKSIVPFIDGELMALLNAPIKYRHSQGGGVAFGIPATALPKICEVWLRARDRGSLATKPQLVIAQRAEILMRGLAHVGITALVDEVTGYQRDRAADALTKILEAFIDKELQPWVRTFPPDFYEEMFRLRGLPYPPESVRRPQYFGLLTNNIVYDRLAPGVKKELQHGVPRNEAGRPTAKYFQKLTRNTGYPKLREHLGSVITLMKLSDDWDDFMKKLDKFHPKFGNTVEMDI